jgi:hypothetical protein
MPAGVRVVVNSSMGVVASPARPYVRRLNTGVAVPVALGVTVIRTSRGAFVAR